MQIVKRGALSRRVTGINSYIRAAEDLLLVVGGGRADVVDLRQDRLVLLVGRRILRAVEGAVRGFGSQRNGAVEQAGDLRESAIGDLQQAYAFTGVGVRLGKAVWLA